MEADSNVIKLSGSLILTALTVGKRLAFSKIKGRLYEKRKT
jgi:hypothetical protein